MFISKYSLKILFLSYFMKFYWQWFHTIEPHSGSVYMVSVREEDSFDSRARNLDPQPVSHLDFASFAELFPVRLWEEIFWSKPGDFAMV